MAELRCRLQSLVLAMLGKKTGRRTNTSEVLGWMLVPMLDPKVVAFMRTLFPCSHWIYMATNRSDNMSEWVTTNASYLHRIVDHTAQEFNSALHWLGVRGCEFTKGSGHAAPLVLRDEAACGAKSKGKRVKQNAKSKKKRKRNGG